jgi:hypothetical protein
MKTRPNKPDAVNPAIASRFAVVHHWRGVTDPERSTSLPRMRHRIQLFGLLACVLLAGCAYNRQFFSECRPAVPTMRDYAIQHLIDLSQADKQFIAATEPRLAQANYIEVHFTWTNVCEVLSSSPPCEPFKVIDLRKRP